MFSDWCAALTHSENMLATLAFFSPHGLETGVHVYTMPMSRHSATLSALYIRAPPFLNHGGEGGVGAWQAKSPFKGARGSRPVDAFDPWSFICY